MRVAMLSPIAWRTPPRHYGPWENVVSILTEGLLVRGVDVTLFATKDSVTSGRLVAVCPRGYEEDKEIDPKVWECLHISELFEQGDRFDLIHNHFDFLPLTYTGMTSTPVVTTIHGFSSPKILPVYKKYNRKVYYVAISNADRSPELDYIATIHHGIDLSLFTFNPDPGSYLLFFGRIHPDKGTREAIDIARLAGRPLIIAGIVQDRDYFAREVEPAVDGTQVRYVGSADPSRRNELLGRAWALLHPIRFEEPFGLSVVEAMACGTPVIAFNRGSMAEVIDSGKTGFLVSSIEEAAEKVSRVREIDRQACRRWVETRFSADRMVESYLSVYEKILADRSGSGRGPWGHVRVMEEASDYKLNKRLLHPGSRIALEGSPDRHRRLIILQGEALVERNGSELRACRGEVITVGREAACRLANTAQEDLVFLELETAL
jgi:glycosyltransferase involved in cell wall biosynthesis